MDEDIILPDDFQPETAQPQAEEQQTDVTEEDTTQTETPEEQAEQAEQPRIKIKFNHQEKELSHDEAAPLIQKGMNYDKIQERLNSLENDPRFSKYDKVKQLADGYGMSDEELIDALFNQYYESTAQQKGLTPEQVRKEHELKQREQSLDQKEQTQRSKQQEQDMLNKFMQSYPDVKADDIKPETWAKVNEGMDLTAAYTQQQNDELKTLIKTLKQNEENAKKAPVTSVTAHGSQEKATKDPFLEGFDLE